MKCTLRMERAARLNAEKLCERAIRERIAAEKRVQLAEARRVALEDEHRSWTSAAATMLMAGIDPADENLSLLATALPFSGAGDSGLAAVETPGLSRVAKGKGKLVMREPTSIVERRQPLPGRAAGERSP